ncbi:MAG TPA: response regulator transcription factor [Bryobacteraceae bacterium]|nr:response regulator transcription factor [Bryobacteraceae bacterium]
MNLLIVDDNAAVRRLIAGIVTPFADEIRECADGAEALSAYSARRPDLVLMDIRMDGVDGIEATRRIKAADPTARIIIVTDYDDDALRQAAMREGACGYSLKDNLLDLGRLFEEMGTKQGPGNIASKSGESND